VDPASGLLYIADSNHHRIVATDLEGRVSAVIGSARQAWPTALRRAQFARPRGWPWTAKPYLVADTENHALRAVDLDARQVHTLAGDGRLSYSRTAEEGVIRLNSPWGLWREGRVLYIAMAGLHQLWALDLDSGVIGPYAGSGREGLLDGSPASAPCPAQRPDQRRPFALLCRQRGQCHPLGGPGRGPRSRAYAGG
jgi:hypothetical protein